MRNLRFCALLLLFSSFQALAEQECNLLVNPGFSGGHTGGWTDRSSAAQDVGTESGGDSRGNVLRVKIIRDGGKSHGQIVQFVKARPQTAYKVRAEVKADAPGMAYVQVKEMKGRSEGARLSTGANKGSGEWETLEKEFTTSGGTTALQVLLRFRMNSSCIGKSVCFAQPLLAALDGGDDPPPPYVPPQPVKPVVAAPGADGYVTPEGAGRMDGSDWDNALAASRGGLQAAWDRAGPGNTVYVSGGEYGALTLHMKDGGAGTNLMKRLKGVSRDGFSRPSFNGTWKRERPERGPVFITMEPGASFIEVSDIEIHGYKGVILARGPNRGLRIKKIDVTECRDAFWFDGGAIAGLPDSGSGDIEIDGCRVVRYTKRALRTMGGINGMRILNCIADAGGKDFAVEVFPVGFHILGDYGKKKSGVKDRNIIFVNCESRGNWHDAGQKYWNADGFAAERDTENITFARCRAFGNTDGGWDVKSANPKWIDCVAIGNKRNFRVWAQPEGCKAIFENCLSAYSKDYGALGHDAGFWIQGGGDTELIRCTSWMDKLPLAVETKDGELVSRLGLKECLFGGTESGGAFRLDGRVEIDDGTSVSGSRTDEEIRLKDPTPVMGNVGDRFDSVSHPDKGFRNK